MGGMEELIKGGRDRTEERRRKGEGKTNRGVWEEPSNEESERK